MRAPFGPGGPARVPRIEAPRAFDVLRRSVKAGLPRLSVVIPNCNTAQYVCDAVRSVQVQSLGDLEIIVVDDGSTDDSLERLLALEEPRLTVAHQQNRGLAATRNTGVTLARAPFIGFCDSDDVWHPRKAERHLSVMTDAPDIGVTFSFSAYLDERGRASGQLLGSRRAEPRLHDLLKRNHLGNGSTTVVRRSCFESVGLYDESMSNVEEWELWVRIAATTPLRIVRIPEPLTGYRIRNDSLSVSYESFLRNAWLATQRFERYVPDFKPEMAQRGYAEALRIASRKCLASGNVRASRVYLREVARRCPALFVSDSRAVALGALHVLGLAAPARATRAAYHALEQARARFASRTLAEWDWL